MLCLISASFTGCIEDNTETTQEETTQNENTDSTWVGNDVTLQLTDLTAYEDFNEKGSENDYIAQVIKSKNKIDLAELSFFLRDSSGNTYVGGNGFGNIGMKMIGDTTNGIDAYYDGDNENFKARAEEINDDGDGTLYPVKFFDVDRDGYLSAGDLFIIYGPDTGPAYDGWRLDIQNDVTNYIIGNVGLVGGVEES